MNILIVSTSDLGGGAARAAYRLHESLLLEKINSKMLVLHKLSKDSNVLLVNKKVSQKILSKVGGFLDRKLLNRYKKKNVTLFSPAYFQFRNIVKEINLINPDIVHLQWVSAGMLRVEDIAKIKAQIIWSLHDMWPFTGGCHYSSNCLGYIRNCGNCEVLGSKNSNDLSRKVLNRKSKNYSSMIISGVSEWITEQSKMSSLFKKNKHVTIGNPINTDFYKPQNKEFSRELWSLPKDKKLILFGAVEAVTDLRKGFLELCDALKYIDVNNVELVVFGSKKPDNPIFLNFKTHYIDHLNDDISLITLYSSVDVMVVPSIQEAFGQTASEAMACGIPTVAFNDTGLKDIVIHKKTGFLARANDTKDIANGIQWVLNNDNYKQLSIASRLQIVTHFDYKVIAKKYINLYKNK